MRNKEVAHDRRIEKTIDIKAPVERVWRALTDSAEFGRWFRVNMHGPFVVGEVARGDILYPGFEHILWEAKIVRMDAPTAFAFTWHPYAADPKVDYSAEEPTLVEFTLEPTAEGTRVLAAESGFDKVPAWRRDEALRMNTGGWEQQMGNIKAYVEA